MVERLLPQLSSPQPHFNELQRTCLVVPFAAKALDERSIPKTLQNASTRGLVQWFGDLPRTGVANSALLHVQFLLPLGVAVK